MINYPFTIEDKIMMVLEGIFFNPTTRKDVCNTIKDEVITRCQDTNISTIQTVIAEVLYERINK